jgi:type I restriction enzyme R subunit
MKFTEEKLEKAFTELLSIEGFPHYLGNTIIRTVDDVIIESDLLNYLLSRYASQKLTHTEAKLIILQLRSLPSSDLYESNKTILRWLSDGFIFKREDRNQKDIHIELIDYNGLESQLASPDLYNLLAETKEQYQADCNIYKFVNQLEIVGNENA